MLKLFAYRKIFMYKTTWFVGCFDKIIVADENLLLTRRPFIISWDGLV